jgi:hypothetical protein
MVPTTFEEWDDMIELQVVDLFAALRARTTWAPGPLNGPCPDTTGLSRLNVHTDGSIT